MGKYKKAIFDKKRQNRLLAVCKTDEEYITIWMMINTGIHPHDLGKLRLKDLDDDGWIAWKRAKNKKPRREPLPPGIIQKMEKYLVNRRRGKSRIHYYNLVKDVGKRAGLNNISPMTLRHTCCINFIRENFHRPDVIDLVSKKMGCGREIVMQNYLDLVQWEKIGKIVRGKLMI